MFVDKVTIGIHAGDGGKGAVSFRHEKFVDRGGPDGGDGGKGGDVVMVASRNQNTLAAFRYQKFLQAEPGYAGSKRRRHGKSGHNLVVQVPVGTVIANEAGEVLADLMNDGQQVIIASGGKGGFGNAHFVSSRRQAPRIAEKGEKGESMQAVFELKMLADVGLIGLPNAGKSTLLTAISNARPEIANYPFTTLRPNLGMVDIDENTSLLFADIPGLIEGASQGKGLGDEFLRHVERTALLVHLIDAYENVAASYKTIQKELRAYKIDLTGRPQIVVLNKIDGLSDEFVKSKLEKLKKAVPVRTPLFAISAQSGEGTKELLYKVKAVTAKHLKVTKQKAEQAEVPVLRLPETEEGWQVKKIKNSFIITGKKIERFADKTDFTNPAGVQRLRDIMKKMSIVHELIRQNIDQNDTIKIGGNSFKW